MHGGRSALAEPGLKGMRTGRSVRFLIVGLPAAGLAVVAALLGLRLARSGPAEQEAMWLSSGPSRSIEARMSHPAADRYRPYHAGARGNGGSGSGASLEALARLESKGELRALAAAYLIQGAPELAAAYLERAED